MGWNRDSSPTKVLSFFLSVVLAVGLVPLPAFAEAVDEMVSATTDPIATEEPATTEEPAAEPTTTEEPTTEPAAEPTAAEPVAEPVATEDPAADMPAFEGEQVVDGVRVSVAAEAGTFPAGARLRVSKATQAQERQAGEAVGEVRDEGVTVAESHTFDVEVLDANDTPVQPTEGHKVEVSFTQAEVADKNLQTQVYHVTEDAATGELAAQNLDATTQATPETGEPTTVVVQTDGFSLYTVEFTYNDLQYVMPGDTQVPLNDSVRFAVRAISYDEVAFRRGVPVTRAERTVFDLVLDGEELSLVADVLGDAAHVDRDFDLGKLASYLRAAYPRGRADRILEGLLADAGLTWTEG